MRLPLTRREGIGLRELLAVRSMFCRIVSIAVFWYLTVQSVDLASAAKSVPGGGEAATLHTQIDRIVDSARLGPPAEICSDEEFLRRIYLDLAGKIPTREEARQFLQDSSPEKRARLIDRLLADPHFDRNFMRVLDVMLMERRIEKVISPGKFRAFLRTAIEERQPLNELVREILIADGEKDEERAAARFLLDRSAEPHILTRDVGRLFLGVDMQCAQCHDHPSIDDYLQSDYYGIFAFLNRTYLFGSEKGSVVAERAEGEVEFVSVFVGGDPQSMMPHLPGDKEMNEPKMAQSERYIVAPAEGVRPIPKFSRRALLANELTSGKYHAFQKNLANRLWAHMFGRGIVHPLDFHHSANPPTNPDLLSLLAEELANLDFDLRMFLREIALSQTYQRSSELPEELLSYAQSLEGDRKENTQLLKTEEESRKAINDRIDKNRQALADRKNQHQSVTTQIQDLNQQLKQLSTSISNSENQLRTYRETWPALASAEKKLGELRSESEELYHLDPDDKKLEQLFQSTANQYDLILAERDAAKAQIDQIEAKLGPQKQEQASFVAKIAVLNGQLAELESQRQQLQAVKRDLSLQLQSQRNRIVGLQEKMEDLDCLDRWAKTIREQPDDATARQNAQRVVADRWRNRFQCGHVLPLTAEQLTWSISEALGIVAEREQAIRKQMAENAKANEGEKQAEADAKLKETQFVKSLHNQIEGSSLYDFIVNVHDFRGQPDGTYQATAKEALFMSHSKKLQGWIDEAAKQWVQESADKINADQIAEKLYLTILSRQPDAEEAAVVRGYLVARSDDPHAALQDLIWALLSCTEFRFQS